MIPTLLLTLLVVPDSGWRQVSLPPPAGCALETPFSFFVREAPAPAPTRLLIYFEGGGACWDWVSCSGTFDPSVVPEELDGYRGIFDFANPANPFSGFTTVFIPYCTADVHVGTATRRYGDDPAARPIHHNGYRNVRAVLDWVERQGYRPAQVVVAGTSAGSYGALFHFPGIARMFPGARLALIGDSGVPLLPGYPSILRRWGADTLTLETAWREAAAASRGATLALITSDQDRIQSAFYLIAGSRQWREDAYGVLDRVSQAAPAFRSFVIAGGDHQLLPADGFYQYQAGGVALRDWVVRIVEGRPVEHVRCESCRVTGPR
jgi:Pectinacetylesterase